MAASNVETRAQESNRSMNHYIPALAYCPTCGKDVVTEVKISYSKIAHITCVACLIGGCMFGCCLLPYFSMCFVTAKHYCPDCDRQLASYNRFLEFFH